MVAACAMHKENHHSSTLMDYVRLTAAVGDDFGGSSGPPHSCAWGRSQSWGHRHDHDPNHRQQHPRHQQHHGDPGAMDALAALAGLAPAAAGAEGGDARRRSWGERSGDARLAPLPSSEAVGLLRAYVSLDSATATTAAAAAVAAAQTGAGAAEGKALGGAYEAWGGAPEVEALSLFVELSPAAAPAGRRGGAPPNDPPGRQRPQHPQQHDQQPHYQGSPRGLSVMQRLAGIARQRVGWQS